MTKWHMVGMLMGALLSGFLFCLSAYVWWTR